MNRIPIATYRMQFHAGFTFRDAADTAEYLAELGISDLYASPCFQATRGSQHGYDVVNPNRVNEELGGAQGHENLCRVLREHQLGYIQDVVSNHMAVKSPDNTWWWDVLEKGRHSRYAAYFDIDWGKTEKDTHDRILIPVLGDQYGRVVDAGDIQLQKDGGRFFFTYYESLFPMSPDSLGDLLEEAAGYVNSDELAFLGDALRCLWNSAISGQSDSFRFYRNQSLILKRLTELLESNRETDRALDIVIQGINSHAHRMHDLLEAQNYRLAFWRTASHEIGFRRFFDINTLIGLRIEDESVFEETHRLIFKWIHEGRVQGLRIDHIDGLSDPAQYLFRLRQRAPPCLDRGGEDSPARRKASCCMAYPGNHGV